MSTIVTIVSLDEEEVDVSISLALSRKKRIPIASVPLDLGEAIGYLEIMKPLIFIVGDSYLYVEPDCIDKHVVAVIENGCFSRVTVNGNQV